NVKKSRNKSKIKIKKIKVNKKKRMIGLYVARHKRRRHEIKNTSGILPIIQLSKDGHVDIKNRKLVQVNNQESDNDVINLASLKNKRFTGAGIIPPSENDTLIPQRLALCLNHDPADTTATTTAATMERYYECKNKRVKNLADPMDPSDATTKQYVDHVQYELVSNMENAISALQLDQVIADIKNLV